LVTSSSLLSSAEESEPFQSFPYKPIRNIHTSFKKEKNETPSQAVIVLCEYSIFNA
jgi:hypothetical protein